MNEDDGVVQYTREIKEKCDLILKSENGPANFILGSLEMVGVATDIKLLSMRIQELVIQRVRKAKQKQDEEETHPHLD